MKNNDLDIPENKLLLGVNLSLVNATSLLDSCKLLHDDDKFQSAIPLACLSLEESFKGIKIMKKYKEGKNITVKEWKNEFTKHGHKFKDVLQDICERKFVSDLHNSESPKKQLKRHKDCLEFVKHVTALNRVKQLCFYGDWFENEWWLFSRFFQYKKELSYFVIHTAEEYLNECRLYVEDYVNKGREKDLVINSEYPPYEEFREFKNYDSVQLLEKLKKEYNKKKFQTGIKELNMFIQKFHL